MPIRQILTRPDITIIQILPNFANFRSVEQITVKLTWPEQRELEKELYKVLLSWIPRAKYLFPALPKLEDLNVMVYSSKIIHGRDCDPHAVLCLVFKAAVVSASRTYEIKPIEIGIGSYGYYRRILDRTENKAMADMERLTTGLGAAGW